MSRSLLGRLLVVSSLMVGVVAGSSGLASSASAEDDPVPVPTPWTCIGDPPEWGICIPP